MVRGTCPARRMRGPRQPQAMTIANHPDTLDKP